MSIAEFALPDSDLFAQIDTQDRHSHASPIRAARFLALATIIASQAYSAVANASDEETLWIYPDAWEIGEKPTRVAVLSYARIEDYSTRGELVDALADNARKCVRCNKRPRRHDEAEACADYDFARKSVVV